MTLPQFLWGGVDNLADAYSLVRISLVHSESFVIIDPKYGKLW